MMSKNLQFVLLKNRRPLRKKSGCMCHFDFRTNQRDKTQVLVGHA